MTKQDLMSELKEKFKAMKKELGLKTSLDDIDKIFFISDFVLEKGFVSPSFLSRQICARIVDTYMSWVGYLHGLLVPNPQNMIHLTESDLFGKEEKEKIFRLIKKAMVFANTNVLVGLNKNKKQEAKFIDSAVKFWKDSFCPDLINIVEKVKNGWGK